MNLNDKLDENLLKKYQNIFSNQCLLFDLSVIPQMIVNKDRFIIKCNKKFLELFQYNIGEILGYKTVILTHTIEDFYNYKKYFFETVEGYFESAELLYKKKDGTLFWTKLSGRLIYKDDDDFLIFWSFLDISNEVQYRKRIEELNQKKDKLFSIVSHDLRSPFNTILNSTLLIKQNFGKVSVDKIQNYIEMLINSAQNAYNLLENLLTWAKSNLVYLILNMIKLN